MSHTDDFLSYLYRGNNKAAYEAGVALLNEVEDLKRQLAEAKSQNPKPHVVSYSDFDTMITQSIREYVNRAFPITLSRRSISSGHEAHVFMIEAFIALLNKHELLRKPVTFDYRR